MKTTLVEKIDLELPDLPRMKIIKHDFHVLELHDRHIIYKGKYIANVKGEEDEWEEIFYNYRYAHKKDHLSGVSFARCSDPEGFYRIEISIAGEEPIRFWVSTPEIRSELYNKLEKYFVE